MSRIFITGDTHGDYDWSKLNTSRFPEQKTLNKDDYVIILGDFGGVWDDGVQDRYIIKSYNKRNFTTLFIDGNHENHDRLSRYPVDEWNGGKVHRISDSVIHLMRGQIYTINGITFFTMGGAESTDKKYRKEGVSWWPGELPSSEEYTEAVSNLEKNGNKVDCILTHCAPESTVCGMNMQKMYSRKANELTNFFDALARTITFRDWYFGHYHGDSDCGKYHMVYQRIIEL